MAVRLYDPSVPNVAVCWPFVRVYRGLAGRGKRVGRNPFAGVKLQMRVAGKLIAPEGMLIGGHSVSFALVREDAAGLGGRA